MEKQANIGHSIQVKGELTGSEDLVIDGTVDGKIQLKDHDLTIGSTGRITAEIQAKTVVGVGQVKGNITAGNRIEITVFDLFQNRLRGSAQAIPVPLIQLLWQCALDLIEDGSQTPGRQVSSLQEDRDNRES